MTFKEESRLLDHILISDFMISNFCVLLIDRNRFISILLCVWDVVFLSLFFFSLPFFIFYFLLLLLFFKFYLKEFGDMLSCKCWSRLGFLLVKLVILYGSFSTTQGQKSRSQGMLMQIHILPQGL